MFNKFRKAMANFPKNDKEAKQQYMSFYKMQRTAEMYILWNKINNIS